MSLLFNEEKLLNLIFHQVKLEKELILHRCFAKILKKLMLYQIKLKKKNLFSSLFNEEKLLNLIFYQVNLEKDLSFHRYFAGKLKRATEVDHSDL